MKKFIRTICMTLLVSVFVLPSVAQAEKVTRSERLKLPDIQDDFCGAQIDYRICKCARHGEMCADIKREQKVAAYILESKFAAHVAKLRATFMQQCVRAGGRFAHDQCDYVEASAKETSCLPKDWKENWKKYSDIDEAIPVAERSFEAKGVFETGEALKDATLIAYVLERDIELNRLMILELKDFRKAVATNFKVNMLKSFWRLAWLTYDTSAGAAAPMRMGAEGTWLFQGGTDLGRSYAKLFSDELAHGQKLAVLVKLARESMGDSSKYAFNTKTLDGKIGAVSMTTLIAAIENIDSPIEAAKEMFQEITKQSLPDVEVKLSDEDIKLLADQYQSTKTLDAALEEAYRKRALLADELDRFRAERDSLKTQFADWEAKERARAEQGILDSCKK